MKVRIFLPILISLLFLQCNDAKKENVEVGEIIERTPEQISSMREMAPKFTFASIDGNEVSLDDLKGKYVYIDIWATWCQPCLVQIPAMKEMEEKYRDTDIEFVSISVDSERDKPKWQKMINDRGMSGLQLYAGRGTSFHQDYKISSIPRFVLIGKNGELINDNAPRPMDHRTGGINEELISVFDKLLSENS